MIVDFSQADRKKLFRILSRVKHLSKKSYSLQKRVATIEAYLEDAKQAGTHDPLVLRQLERRVQKLKEQLTDLSP